MKVHRATMSASAALLLLMGCTTTGSPKPDYRVAIERPNLTEDIARKIKTDWDNWRREAYCIDLSTQYVDGHRYAFARREPWIIGDTPPVVQADALVALGLLTPVPTSEAMQAAEKTQVGQWYAFTETGKAMLRHRQTCYGKRTFARVVAIGEPYTEPWSSYQRKVTFEYTVSDMPAFTQTEVFKKAFKNVPSDGDVGTASLEFHLVWKADWYWADTQFPF